MRKICSFFLFLYLYLIITDAQPLDFRDASIDPFATGLVPALLLGGTLGILLNRESTRDGFGDSSDNEDEDPCVDHVCGDNAFCIESGSNGAKVAKCICDSGYVYVLGKCVVYPGHLAYAEQYLGGNGGKRYNDYGYWGGDPITAVRLKCGSGVISIQFRYGTRWGLENGDNCNSAGIEGEFELSPTEIITSLESRFGSVLDSLTITTNERTLPTCGGAGGSTTRTATGKRLLFISGRADCAVDAIEPHWLPH